MLLLGEDVLLVDLCDRPLLFLDELLPVFLLLALLFMSLLGLVCTLCVHLVGFLGELTK